MAEVKSKIKNQKSKIEIKDTKATRKKVVAKPAAKAQKDAVESSANLQNEAKTVKKTVRKTLSVDMYDTKGKVSGSIELPQALFGVKVNKALLAQYVRVYLANQRRGTASTKTRGEVHGSTRKIYRQKGTGRARHGGLRAPIFVHGGVAWGPKPRDFSLSLPQKMKQQALCSALSSKQKDGNIKIIKNVLSVQPKTKEMVAVVKNLGLEEKKRNVLFVLPQVGAKTENLVRAVRNIEGVTYMPAQTLNAYAILHAKHIVFAQEAVVVVEQTFGRKS